MKRGILTGFAAALAAALLYVPQRGRYGEISYTWVFRITEPLDVTLLLVELALIGLVALSVYVFVSAGRRK